MNFLKYTQYFYLVFGAFFLYDGIDKYINNQPFWLSIGFAVIAIFMFFFRRKFAKKFDERNNNQKNQ